ncbi:hypothetical protein WA026_013478 [Henosepilachna vigintioctopunctata]|uniref:PH domain-containing protein n=1 Tax=Henosepilachna vigintioctopunctata TaxID=420089 RepID=A0AAW1V634_9CUCU
MKSGVKFDVIIADWFFNFAILYYGKKLNAPVIALSHQGADNVATILTGNPGESSYIAGIGLDFPVEMSFFQRSFNGIYYTVMNILGRKHIRYHQELLKKYFNDTMTTPEMISTLALVLSNSHYSFESPRPYVPNIIPIGGFHVSPPKALPESYQSFLDSAQSGAIYCSLGSTSWKSTLPTKALDAIMKAFSDLHMKSCPHNDILAHPYVKIFICHGDLLSIIEAIHHAVPVLGIPFYEDQRINIVSAVRQGYAIHLELDDLNDENFSFAVNDLIFDPTFEEKIVKLSHLLRDQPVSPMDTAVFWVEHVIRHKGGCHLKNHGTYIPWYHYYMLDVFFLVSFLVNGFIAVVIMFLRDYASVVSPPHLFVVTFIFLTENTSTTSLSKKLVQRCEYERADLKNWETKTGYQIGINKQIKGGYLLRYRRGLFCSGWSEEWVVLYEDSTIAWYADKGLNRPRGRIRIGDSPDLLAVGEWTRKVPKRPKFPRSCHIGQLLAIGSRRPQDVQWLIAQSPAEVNDWMTAISNTLPPPPHFPLEDKTTPNKQQSLHHQQPKDSLDSSQIPICISVSNEYNYYNYKRHEVRKPPLGINVIRHHKKRIISERS